MYKVNGLNDNANDDAKAFKMKGLASFNGIIDIKRNQNKCTHTHTQ